MTRPNRPGSNWKDEVAAILGNVTPNSMNRFAKGTRVFHQKFGYGRIQSVSGDHLEIDFEKAGQKKLLSDYVKKVEIVLVTI